MRMYYILLFYFLVIEILELQVIKKHITSPKKKHFEQ